MSCLMLLTVVAVAPASVNADGVFATIDSSNSSTEYNSGYKVNVTFTLGNIALKSGDGVSAFGLYLHYDKDKVEPVAFASEDSEGDMTDFFALYTKAPLNWKAMGTLDTENGYYDLAFGDFNGARLVTDGAELQLEVPFMVKESTKVDDIVFTIDNIVIYNSDLTKSCKPDAVTVTVSYAAQPFEQVALPDDAIGIQTGNYRNGDNFVSLTKEEMTVSDFVADYDNQAGNQTMSDYALAIADANGNITYVDTTDSDKSAVVIPANSIVIGVHRTNTDEVALLAEKASTNASVTFYNLNLEATGKPGNVILLSNVGFTVAEKTPIPKSDAKINLDLEGGKLKIFGDQIDIEDFKAMFENDVTVVDKDGNEVTTGVIKTSMRIDYGDGITILLMGDVNFDGKVSSLDYIKLKRHILKSALLTGDAFEAGCVTGGTKPKTLDYIAIKRHCLKAVDITSQFRG